MPRKTKKPEKNKNVLLIILSSIVALIVGLVVWFSSIVPYTLARIRCGHTPIVGQHGLFGSANYYRPIDTGNLGLGGEYFCNEQEAIAAGFTNSTKDSAYVEYTSSLETKAQEDAKFSPSKVAFTVYTPSYLPTGYARTKIDIMLIEQKEVFQTFKADQQTFTLRQGLGSTMLGYGACGHMDTCESMGKDDKKRTIFKGHSNNNGATFWGVDVDNTYVTLEGDLALTDLQRVFSSLQPIH